MIIVLVQELIERHTETNSAKSQQYILSSNRALDTGEKWKVVTIA